ncbi:MAG TPA: Ku protein [Pyrinomonadaceae bacterium]|jgi:DNA end-binding protein Ku|nr:Ku protein [Pyrinomonadaceae bacterium]
MRSIWKGHIRFLLVAIPIRVYNAIEASERIQFNQLHRDDFGPVGYDKRCKKCGQIVTNDQITKGYQYEPDRYAIVEPEEIAKIKIKTTRAVDILGFVEKEEVAPMFFDAPYYIGPDGPVAEKPFALLRQVLKDTGKIGLAKVVLRDREDLVAVFPHGDGIVLQKLRYPAEVRKIEDVPEIDAAPKLDKKELALATSLVEQMITTFSDIDTVDHYHEALRKLIDSKIKGKKVTEFEKYEELPRMDIMTALKKSLQASSRKPMVKAAPAAKKKAALTLVKSKPAAAKKRKVG